MELPSGWDTCVSWLADFHHPGEFFAESKLKHIVAWRARTVKATVLNEMILKMGDIELDAPGVRCFHLRTI